MAVKPSKRQKAQLCLAVLSKHIVRLEKTDLQILGITHDQCETLIHGEGDYWWRGEFIVISGHKLEVKVELGSVRQAAINTLLDLLGFKEPVPSQKRDT